MPAKKKIKRGTVSIWKNDMNELRELGVTYISIVWFKDMTKHGLGHFQLEETGKTFHEIRPASFDQVNEEVKKVIRELKKENQDVR